MIHLVGVEKRFGEVAALAGVDLEIESGEAVLLTGPSGSGKSTLLRLLIAAERPDHGRILLCGRDVARLRRSAIPYLRRNIGVVFQDGKLLGDRSAIDNVALALQILGMGKKRADERAAEALAAVGLGERTDALCNRLSGSEQQRVAVARAIVGSPEILLCDEPTAPLDPAAAEELLDLFDRLRQEGTTLIVATHEARVVRFGETRGWHNVRLEAGRIVGSRTPAAQADDDPTDRQSPVLAPLSLASTG